MGWFHDVFGFSSQDITDPITKAVQDVVDPVKGVIGETGIGAGLGSLAALGFAPFTGGATLAMLPYMAAGGGMLGGGMEEEGNLLGNILSGGLQGYGLGSLGAALGGVNVAPMFGGAGVAGGAGPLAKGAIGAPFQMDGQTFVPGKMRAGLTETGAPSIYSWLGLDQPQQQGGNILTNLLGNIFGGGQQGGGLDLGNILGALTGAGGAGAGAGAGGIGGGGVQPYVPMQIPPGPTYPTTEEVFGEAMPWAREQFPEAFGAREAGLAAIPGLAKPREWYEQFGPTSMEEALASEYFKYAAPEAQRAIAQRMSLQGMGESPITAALMGRETGKLGVDIGQYLAGQGQRRAELAQEAEQFGVGRQMGVSPFDVFGPYGDVMMQQQGLQQQADYATRLAQAQEQQKGAFATEQERLAKRGLTGSLIGGGIGTLLGGSQLGALGATLGGPIAGGTSPFGYQQALGLSSLLPQQWGGLLTPKKLRVETV